MRRVCGAGSISRSTLRACASASPLDRWDVLLLLLLLHLPRHYEPTAQVLGRALARGALRVATLVGCASEVSQALPEGVQKKKHLPSPSPASQV